LPAVSDLIGRDLKKNSARAPRSAAFSEDNSEEEETRMPAKKKLQTPKAMKPNKSPRIAVNHNEIALRA
jgi:hypothetical protein